MMMMWLQIEVTVMQQLLPQLFKYLKGKRVRSTLALAIVRLLLRLPRKRMEAVLPRILSGISEIVRSDLLMFIQNYVNS